MKATFLVLIVNNKAILLFVRQCGGTEGSYGCDVPFISTYLRYLAVLYYSQK